MAPENITKWQQFHDTILINEKLLPMDEQRMWFVQMESTPEEDY